MVLIPQTRDELTKAVAQAAASRTAISHVDLRHLSSVTEHTAEDMTATVEAGLTLSEFQDILQRAGQWLPIDPPESASVTIADLLAHDLSGPRRFGYGTIRDYLIGIRVVLASGELIRAGGNVVKNVAGYDLCKLFVGARHSLGVIVEATFKLRPLPELERIVESYYANFTELGHGAQALLAGPVEPVILDAHNLEERPTLVLGFAGTKEDVEAQLHFAQSNGVWTESSTEYNERFAKQFRSVERKSVLPSRTAEVLHDLRGTRLVARFGNGIIYGPRSTTTPGAIPNARLLRKMKDAYDPHGILPEYRP